jgi:hypothetical protein
VLFIIAYKVIKNILNGGNTQNEDEKKATLDNITYDVNQMSFTELQGSAIADNLFNILNVNIWIWPLYSGSFDELMGAISVVKNQNDANYIIKKFGLKAPTLHVIPFGVWTPKINEPMNLPDWFQYQLKGDDLATVKAIFYLV